jgi:flagellar biosynthetic protein FlhB
MAERSDKESRTEEPTEKKIADAVEKGNVPRSREMAVFASLLGVLIAAAFLIGTGSVGLTETMTVMLDSPGGFLLDSGPDANRLLWAIMGELTKFLAPVVFMLMLAGLAAAFFQHAPTMALDQIKPKWSRVSPADGWKRLFGAPGLMEFVKSLFKFGAIGVVCAFMLSGEQSAVTGAMFLDPSALPGLILSLVIRLVSVVCVAIAIMVAGDIVWSRFRWRSELRMTRQELKDELKDSEGDPLVKSKRRSLARDRARRRMIASVPKATVVVANPTHYAIALHYDRTKGGAPLVVAKGADLIALKIREIASKHSVPIVEDKPLARALYDAVEVGQWIPPEFYRAVAKILHHIYARLANART